MDNILFIKSSVLQLQVLASVTYAATWLRETPSVSKEEIRVRVFILENNIFENL